MSPGRDVLAVTLRLAMDADIAALQAVERDADTRFGVAGEVIPEDHAKRAIASGRIVVAEVAEGDRHVVGWVYLGAIDGEPCIGQISVAVAYGRRGIGTTLLNRALAMARETGARSVVLNTQRDEPWNAPWYSRHGFVVVPEEAWTDGLRAVAEHQTKAGLDWSKRVHMRRVL